MGCGSDYNLTGWIGIIEQLDRDLRALDPDYVIDQIKEKFGGLRYYASFGYNVKGVNPDQWYKLVDEAEAESYKTCMHCGSKNFVSTGTDNGGRWVRTLCEGCRPLKLVPVVIPDNFGPED